MSLVATLSTGDHIVGLARQHVGEPYILGARAPMANPNWKGPWTARSLLRGVCIRPAAFCLALSRARTQCGRMPTPVIGLSRRRHVGR